MVRHYIETEYGVIFEVESWGNHNLFRNSDLEEEKDRFDTWIKLSKISNTLKEFGFHTKDDIYIYYKECRKYWYEVTQ